ncbi:MAG: hypothetical protein NVSMB30_23700 [Hymenobacter sp.]
MQVGVELAQLGFAARQVFGHLVVVGRFVGQLSVAVFEQIVVTGVELGVEAAGFAVGLAGLGRVGDEALQCEAQLGQQVD